jgi:hypothetical protein
MEQLIRLIRKVNELWAKRKEIEESEHIATDKLRRRAQRLAREAARERFRAAMFRVW